MTRRPGMFIRALRPVATVVLLLTVTGATAIAQQDEEMPVTEKAGELKGKARDAHRDLPIIHPNITMDLNFDGKVEAKGNDRGADDELEKTKSMILVCDCGPVEEVRSDKKAELYKLAEEPAQRQKLVIQNNDLRRDSVALYRSSKNLNVSRDPLGKEEVTWRGANQDFAILPPGVFWVGAGDNRSTKPGDEWLRAEPGQLTRETRKKVEADTILFTVVWTELIVRTGAPRKMLEPPAFDEMRRRNIIKLQGHDLLGVRVSEKGSSDGSRQVRGIAEIVACIEPNLNFDRDVFGRSLGARSVGGSSATANAAIRGELKQLHKRFGFVIRRVVRVMWYTNGHTFRTVGKQTEIDDDQYQNDDSAEAHQDAEPDKVTVRCPREAPAPRPSFVIVDNDGPGIASFVPDNPRSVLSDGTSVVANFQHLRANFKQYVVFYRYGKNAPPERVSEIVRWSVTMDWGYKDENTPVFIGSKPNDGAGTNEVLAYKHLDEQGLRLNLPKPRIDDVTLEKIGGRAVPKGDKRIRIGQTATLRIKGRDLVGVFFLVRHGEKIPGQSQEKIPLLSQTIHVERLDPITQMPSEILLTFMPDKTLIASETHPEVGVRLVNISGPERGNASNRQYSDLFGSFPLVEDR